MMTSPNGNIFRITGPVNSTHIYIGVACLMILLVNMNAPFILDTSWPILAPWINSIPTWRRNHMPKCEEMTYPLIYSTNILYIYIYTIIEKVSKSNHVCDHGFVDVMTYMYTKHQAVCNSQKERKSFKWFTHSRTSYVKIVKTHNNQSRRPAVMLNASINTFSLHQCSYISTYNAKTSLSCIRQFHIWNVSFNCYSTHLMHSNDA